MDPAARIQGLEEPLRQFTERWGLRRLSLFGSIVRDDFGPDSDVDILIEPGVAPPRGFDSRFAMEDELEALLGRRVDLVYVTGLVNPYRRSTILRTAQTVYRSMHCAA